MAFVKEILPNSTVNSKDGRLVHQSNPAYVLTFITWQKRDVYGIDGSSSKGNLDVNKPLVVENDAIDIKITNSKVGLTPSLDITLKNGDIDYSSVLAPGDFVFVNLLDWEDKAREVANRARAGLQINRYEDGFKGLFKIQTIGRSLVVQRDGSKSVQYNVKAYGFTEFNNVIYYDPVAAAALKSQGKDVYMWQNFGDYIGKVLSSRKFAQIQETMKVLFEVLIGSGDLQNKNGRTISPNIHYRIPEGLSKFLGIDNGKYAADIYHYYFGVWPNSEGSKVGQKNRKESKKGIEIGKGFNPGFKPYDDGNKRWFKTDKLLQGIRLLAPSYWNKIKVWAIVKSYLNSVINEMYTANRVGLDGNVYPSIVARQKPFNSLERQDFFKKNKIPYTTYLNLPRWKVHPALLYSSFLGKNEASRINFVQVYTQSTIINSHQNQAFQSTFNTVIDRADIERTGLRPFTSTANFNFPFEEGESASKGLQKSAVAWSHLASDWLFNGHLREVGSFEFHGIVDPIEVGDNLEFDGSVYHIESITHRFSVRKDGMKTFRTKISVSYGTSLKSDSKKTVYPHTESTTYLQEQTKDYNNEQILPGISDTQNVVGRKGGVKIEKTKRNK